MMYDVKKIIICRIRAFEKRQWNIIKYTNAIGDLISPKWEKHFTFLILTVISENVPVSLQYQQATDKFLIGHLYFVKY